MIDKIKKIITNFSIGISILMLSYSMLFLMGGESAYRYEISSFEDVSAFIMQCLGTGIFYILFDNILKYLIKFVSVDESKDMNFKKLFKFLGVTIIGFPLISIILRFVHLPVNVEKIYFFNIIMLTVISVVISMVCQAKEVKKINNFLQKRNVKTNN